jgi:hypothetical protein
LAAFFGGGISVVLPSFRKKFDAKGFVRIERKEINLAEAMPFFFGGEKASCEYLAAVKVHGVGAPEVLDVSSFTHFRIKHSKLLADQKKPHHRHRELLEPVQTQKTQSKKSLDKRPPLGIVHVNHSFLIKRELDIQLNAQNWGL